MTTGSGVALFVEIPGFRALPAAGSLQIASAGLQATVVTHRDAAIELIRKLATDQNKPLRFLVANAPDFELFDAFRSAHPDATSILVTGEPIHKYADALNQKDVELVDQVIANTLSECTTDSLRVTMQKIIRGDLFGIEKYLYANTTIHERIVRSSRDRESCNAEVQKWIESCGQNKSVGRLTFGIAEELVMNAVYDAPVAGGRQKYERLERHEARDLEPDEYAKLRYATDGHTIAISIIDPFGAFTREKWWHYARKILKRNDSDSLIDTKKGGAGLGIFKMLYSSHAVVCNVEPGKRTEVIVLMDLRQPLRDFSQMPRSIHYFKLDQSPKQ